MGEIVKLMSIYWESPLFRLLCSSSGPLHANLHILWPDEEKLFQDTEPVLSFSSNHLDWDIIGYKLSIFPDLDNNCPSANCLNCGGGGEVQVAKD